MVLFQLDFRFGLILFFILIFSGISTCIYAVQVTSPIQVPVTQYTFQTQSDLAPVYQVVVNQTIVAGGSVSFGPWNNSNDSFDGIAINFQQTSESTKLTIVSAQHGLIYFNSTNNQGLHYVGVYSNDTYTLTIENLNPNQHVYINGTITVFHIESQTQPIPYTTYETSYQTQIEYPYRTIGEIIILIGAIVGMGLAVSVLLSKRKTRE